MVLLWTQRLSGYRSILTRAARSANITDRLHWNATTSSSSSKSLKYYHFLLSPLSHHSLNPVPVSLEIDPPGNLEDILVGEWTIWIEVVTARPLQPSHQLAHVSCKTVLGRGSC